MELKDYITISAVLLSPLIAVQVEKFIERTRSSKNKKVQIFKTLMATRGSRISIEHVTALNQIDLEFYSKKKYSETLDAWKEYFDHLNVTYTPETFNIWDNKTNELFTNLLHEMGKSLGLVFGKATIKRNIYSPTGHVKAARENEEIRELLIKVLKGDNPIATYAVMSEEALEMSMKATEKTGELQSILIENNKRGIPVLVKIITDTPDTNVTQID